MRDAETIETELMEISSIADDTVKLERIIAWCASHPDEVPFALHHLMGRREKHPPQASSAEVERRRTRAGSERVAGEVQRHLP